MLVRYANESSCLTHHRTETRGAGSGGYNSVGFRIVAAPVAAASSAPNLSAAGILNGASGAAGVSAGAWISIYGTNFASTTRTMASSDEVNGYVPTTLGGVSAQIDGKAAFIYFVSPSQLNVIAPDDTNTGSVQVTVTNSSGTSATVTVALQAVLPGLFLSGNYALAVRPSDGVIINGTGAAASGYSTAAAAKPGDVLELFGTGLGATSPTVPSGLVFSGAYQCTNAVTVTIGFVTSPVSWAGLIGAGLYQLNVTVPASLASGSYPVIVSVAGVSSPAGAMLSIKSI